MRAIYILLVFLVAALVSGCVDKKDKDLSNTTAGILPESYVSEVDGNLTQIESILKENEENIPTEVSDSAFT